MSILYISHNLAVIAQIAHDVMVMYLGRVVEQAPTLQWDLGDTYGTVAVRMPPERTAVSPKTDPAVSRRRTTRCPSTVL